MMAGRKLINGVIQLMNKQQKQEMGQGLVNFMLDDLSLDEIAETLDEITAKITVINENSINQKLVATTRFLTDNGELFRLKKYIEAPANGQIEAEIYADAPQEIIKEMPFLIHLHYQLHFYQLQLNLVDEPLYLL